MLGGAFETEEISPRSWPAAADLHQPQATKSSKPRACQVPCLQKSAPPFGNCSHTANTPGRDPSPGSREVPRGSHASGDAGLFIPSRSLALLLCVSVEIGLIGRAAPLSFPSSLTYFLRGFFFVFVSARRFSLVAAGGGYSSLQCAGFSLR